MSEEYGADFVTVTDEDGNEYELEHLGSLEHKDITYMAFVPADMDEDDEDYGIIILRVEDGENGEQLLADVDDEEELNLIYDIFMEKLFEDEDDQS